MNRSLKPTEKTKTQPAHRLSAIEGLRGYLAISILISHAIQTTSYTQKQFFGPLAGPWGVECFMIISGFVIFMMIDSKKESYPVFITRRFLRIFPVYILLFALAIPCAFLSETLFTKSSGPSWFYVQGVVPPSMGFDLLWKNIHLHVPLHLFMIHGLIPDRLLLGSATAFLAPAWSLSLEWQFYVIAPLWFYLATAKAVWKQFLAHAVCLAMLLFSKRFIPHVSMDAAFPLRIEYFYCGLASYFLYRMLKNTEIKNDRVFPMLVFFSLAMYKFSDRTTIFVPFILWALVFGLLLEPASSLSSRYIMPIFSNRISVWLGKISFSIYLSHALVLIVLKWSLLSIFPSATRSQHLLILTLSTLGMTILFSAVLYYGIEAPFISLGKKLAGGSKVEKTSLAERNIEDPSLSVSEVQN